MLNHHVQQPKQPILIAISLRKLKPFPYPMGYPQPQQAVFTGSCTERGCSFTFESGPLNGARLQSCHDLQKHGFTVVEFSDEEHFFHADRVRWQDYIIRQAMQQIGSLYQGREEMIDMSGYDPELAHAVLQAAQKVFPNKLTMVELKHEISPEPSDAALFTAIEALLIDRLVEAPSIRSGMFNQIGMVAYVRITAAGRQHLAGQSAAPSTAGNTVVEGNQIINYGSVGAIGTHAHGVVNVTHQSMGIEYVDLQVLALQLDELRSVYRSSATSREDDRQTALLGDAAEAAEKGDRKGVASVLTRVSKTVLKKAQDIGTDVLAKTIAELIRPG